MPAAFRSYNVHTDPAHSPPHVATFDVAVFRHTTGRRTLLNEEVMERVLVNGAWIEQSYLDENVAEARSYSWVAERMADNATHDHCIICGIAISPGDNCYYSQFGRLCPYCFDTFVKGYQGA